MLNHLITIATLALLSGCDVNNGVPAKVDNTKVSNEARVDRKTTTRHEPQSAIGSIQNQTQLKIENIKKTLSEPGQSLIIRIEICDHLAGELNGVPAEDIKITQDMKDERCSELNVDIANTSDPVTLNAINSVRKILEEQFEN